MWWGPSRRTPPAPHPDRHSGCRPGYGLWADRTGPGPGEGPVRENDADRGPDATRTTHPRSTPRPLRASHPHAPSPNSRHPVSPGPPPPRRVARPLRIPRRARAPGTRAPLPGPANRPPSTPAHRPSPRFADVNLAPLPDPSFVEPQAVNEPPPVRPPVSPRLLRARTAETVEPVLAARRPASMASRQTASVIASWSSTCRKPPGLRFRPLSSRTKSGSTCEARFAPVRSLPQLRAFFR